MDSLVGIGLRSMVAYNPLTISVSNASGVVDGEFEQISTMLTHVLCLPSVELRHNGS